VVIVAKAKVKPMNAPNTRVTLPSIVVAGHICLDIIPEIGSNLAGNFQDNFQPGRLLEVGTATLSTGGVVPNTGLALHRLGIPTRLICKTGQDAFGTIIREIVDSKGAGLSAGIHADPNLSTSYTLIISPKDVDRIFLHNPGANHSFNADDIDYAMVSQSALFHFGYPPLMRKMYENNGQGLVDLFRRAKQTGATTSLDMSYPDPATEAGQADWVSILKAALPYVDIFVPSIEELLFMLRRSDYQAMNLSGAVLDQVTPALLHSLSDELLSMGIRLAVIKLGERGLYLRSAGKGRLLEMGRGRPSDLEAWSDKEFWAPCFRVRVVGTTGAGDTTIAGFFSALLRDFSPVESVTAAVAVGACNVEAPDALSGLRSWDETIQRINYGWERLPLSLDDPDWHWDEIHQLWYRAMHVR
jgi:sugar/nucleoside kinase (ribokinase family)